jgi:myosin-18
LKEAIEKLNSECDLLRSKELSSQEQSRKLQRQLRDLKEEHANAQQRETESFAKKHELEKQLVFLMAFFYTYIFLIYVNMLITSI